MMPLYELVVKTGKHAGKRLRLPPGKELTVGREAGCQIVLNSSLVSRRHCQLLLTDGGIVVTDVGSQNGTYVNDVAIDQPTLLKTGDVLRIGAILFEVQKLTEESVAATPSRTPAPAIPRRKSEDPGGISDADIASWLSEQPAATTSGDTTEIDLSASPTSSTISASKPAAPPRGASPPAAAPRRFKSIKEEAADIIRRHWEKLRAEGKKPPTV